MDKLCATCGKQLGPEQGFCESCGTAWTPAGAVSAVPLVSASFSDPLPVTPQAGSQVRTSGAGGTLIIVAITLVALLGIGGWLFLRFRPHAGMPASSSSTTMMTSTTSGASSSTATGGVAAPANAVSGTPEATAAATEAAAGSKPCSLLTRAEMETILGAKIVKVTANELSCSYFTDDTMSAEVDTKWSGGKDAIAEVKGFNSAPGLFEPVAGIGDEAYMQGAGVLHVLKGDTYVVVNAREYPSDSSGGHVVMESAIARKALEKLQ
jgi:hypothetical protein